MFYLVNMILYTKIVRFGHKHRKCFMWCLFGQIKDELIKSTNKIPWNWKAPKKS